MIRGMVAPVKIKVDEVPEHDEEIFDILQTQDLKTLNLHLKTCEIYECNECECVAKQISGIKKHIKNSNSCRDASIHHVKIDRDNDKEAAA